MRLIQGDSLAVLPTLGLDPARTAVVTDPPWGTNNDTDSTRFSGGKYGDGRRGRGHDDWPEVMGDDRPFDPMPWLGFGRVILWGANHYAQRLPPGSTLVWIKRADELFGSFLSDAEIAWQKGGCGVYCYREQFPPPCRIREGVGAVLHPNQKPVGLLRWCIGRLKIPPGWTILDPYMGSATTGIAALEMGYDFVGIEQNPAYFAVASKRLDEAQRCRDGRGVGPLFAGIE